ncbi:YeeE/YedE family protein [Terrimonas pollutisoli]|uniref:YeeE/YedE family protein n=1 Tax=Terrimonas pollutisoli TaxID=3034147 RepID=UPI0023ED3BAA|nr:YeeE/YedE thiosulfate transporter family protein [Terrimonas sp. H1YJ31]
MELTLLTILDWLKQPWPWYISGPLIGLMVPGLLLIGNKSFGISSSLRHICAACIPAKIPFFQYDWKKEMWNLFFVTGILLGAMIVAAFLQNPDPVKMNANLVSELQEYGVTDYKGLVPSELFNWNSLFTIKGVIMIVVGGFLVGFGTRYAGGCTSGHAIMGLSNLQFPSLVATISFMAGGFFVANLILPWILKL